VVSGTAGTPQTSWILNKPQTGEGGRGEGRGEWREK